ncbi:MAG: hypothetical protein CVV25_13355 [Ignavibacteriae bacterium HGW-Ignavibacteriae-4]|nr:MAG: hypothetical protein CVV25_13355 [Ignavibacteriae bacterium HGW-Ignavibacteriae-4]
MNKHLCNGNVKNVTAFVKADHCGHDEVVEKEVPKCHQKKEVKKEKSCCENDTQELKNKEQYIAYNKVSLEQLSVLQAVVTAYTTTEDQSSESDDFLVYESPPPISMRQSLHIIHEKYLI